MSHFHPADLKQFRDALASGVPVRAIAPPCSYLVARINHQSIIIDTGRGDRSFPLSLVRRFEIDRVAALGF